jgi:hypothetical protein
MRITDRCTMLTLARRGDMAEVDTTDYLSDRYLNRKITFLTSRTCTTLVLRNSVESYVCAYK